MADTKSQVNLARGKPARQSTTGYGGNAAKAVDGNTNTRYNKRSCTHTHRASNSWWRVDLQRSSNIQKVKVFNRGDCCGNRLRNFEVRVGNQANRWNHNGKCGNRHSIQQGKSKQISCSGKAGRFVFVVLRKRDFLTLCEVEVYAGSAAKSTPPPPPPGPNTNIAWWS